MNKDSTDYNSNDVADDPRLVNTRKDGYIAFISYTIFTIILVAVGFAICPPAGETQTTYILGYPAWYTIGTLMCVGYAVFAIIYTLRLKSFSLDKRASDEEVKE